MQNSLGQITINLGGLTCTACEYRIEKALKKLDGVDSVKVSFASSTAEIIYNSEKTDLSSIYDTIEKTGYEVVYDYDEIEEDSPNTSTFLILLIIAGLYIIIKNTVGFNFLPQNYSKHGLRNAFYSRPFYVNTLYCNVRWYKFVT
jgi:copper chaperone CopZ